MPRKKRVIYPYLPRTGEVDAETPLMAAEMHFLKYFLKTQNFAEAVRRTPEIMTKGKTSASLTELGKRIFNLPNVQSEYNKIMEEIRKDTLASSKEVMEYFTSVMRGEIKDQFGLDAPLSERTKAAQELAKRTVDIENREAGKPDQSIAIKLDWSR